MVEVEIKLAIGAPEPEVRRLLDLGARVVSPRSFEDNILLDVGGGELRARGAMLRLRRYADSSTLTYKEPLPGPTGFKVRREIESIVPEPGTVLRVLEAAGFLRLWRYTKYRTMLRIGDLTVSVDETPIGNFLELEGPSDAIDVLARRLGRKPADYITSTYRHLMELWCSRRGLEVTDMVFGPEPTS